MKRKYIIIILLLTTFVKSHAQIRLDPFFPYSKWTVGAGAGFSEIYGNLSNSNSEPVVRVSIDRNVNMWVSLGLEVQRGALSDYEVKNTWTNGLSVYNQITTAALNGKVSLGEFFKYPRNFFQKTIFGLYGGIGIGFMDNNVSDITLKFKHQDKYTINNYDNSNINPKTTNFYMPYNLGFNLHITRRIMFNINYQFCYAFSDYLDGYDFKAPTATNKYNDMFSVLSFGVNVYLGKVGFHKMKYGNKGDNNGSSYAYPSSTSMGISSAEQKSLMENYDSDGDGIPDRLDKCPGTPPGVAVDATGCPLDRDGDGIPDYLDKCPDVKGTAEFNGCPEKNMDPDTDGDGVPDRLDKCPGTPAGVKVDANGCPLDRDGDGVPDYLDKCPDVKGSKEADGCPVVGAQTKKVLDEALTGIQFETSKDIIQKTSIPIVDNVVKVMKDNPSYKLQINGYTDNRGKPEANRSLSEKRAIAVMKYLENHGIDGNRLKAAGYGQEKPISTNDTEEGRKQNRRVELIVSF